MKIRKISAWEYPYSAEELSAASDTWGCNCGPGALAAMLGLKPNDVRAHIPHFYERRYTNPSMMKQALASLGVSFRVRSTSPPELTEYGLCRIQWDGPWTRPGVPAAAAYRKTHWIGARISYNLDRLGRKIPDTSDGNEFVFDINGGWFPITRWAAQIVPELAAMNKGATGKWWPTHRWELGL